MCSRQDDPRLGQHLVDLLRERSLFALLLVPHRLLQFAPAVAAGAQPREAVPKKQGQNGDSSPGDDRAENPEDLLGNHCHVEPERQGEG